MPDLPDIADVTAASRQSGLAMDASELHGSLCGWLAGGGTACLLYTSRWLARALADDQLPAPAAGSALDQLRQTAVAQLEDRSFAFDLLLPAADRPLDERAEALFSWCQGFLGAFGLAAGASPPLSEEGQEALQDLARLAQASAESSDDEEDEDALAELEEFVRVAVLLLHGDCVLGPRHRRSLN
ncbi:UPF0149 family protein [Pseudoxanthomonas mexicana]|uniref:UPF0149 family protein n=1 Tax=Pseudoxanthomonas mexicana TaxID=128785 RepID=UPI000784617A|nr:UPF0149 family protein [Pseudoxanthomonas mexicana]